MYFIKRLKVYMEEEENLISWEFTDIFKSNDSRIVCVIDILEAFENFPPDTRLNCDDYYSLLSVFCENIPYPFIVFVCECVDPSISSGTLLSHRIAFGSFLLAFPCCILFPQFVHKFLTLFKTFDKQKAGVISRSLFLNILQDSFKSFIKPKSEMDDDLENEGGDEIEEDVENEKKKKKDQFTTIDPLKLPDFSMVDEIKRATVGLDEASVQTLFFVMWQKDPTLLHCKSRIKPENYMSLRNPPKIAQHEQQFVEEEEFGEASDLPQRNDNENNNVGDDEQNNDLINGEHNNVNNDQPLISKEENGKDYTPDLQKEEYDDYNSDETQDEN